MGYYAEFKGSITLNPITAKEEQDLISKYNEMYHEKASSFIDISGWGGERDVYVISKTDATVQYGLDLYGDEKYYEEEVRAFLNLFLPCIESGEIDFIGADNSIWRMIFRDGHWDEESGAIVYYPPVPKDFSSAELLHELLSRCSKEAEIVFCGKIRKKGEKMISYRCKKELVIAEYDDDGRCTDSIMNVEPGEILQSSDDRNRLIGGPETIRLENAQHWIEIDAVTLSEYFEEVSLTERGDTDAGR